MLYKKQSDSKRARIYESWKRRKASDKEPIALQHYRLKCRFVFFGDKAANKQKRNVSSKELINCCPRMPDNYPTTKQIVNSRFLLVLFNLFFFFLFKHNRLSYRVRVRSSFFFSFFTNNIFCRFWSLQKVLKFNASYLGAFIDHVNHYTFRVSRIFKFSVEKSVT